MRQQRRFLIWISLPAILFVLLVAIWPLAQGLVASLYDDNLLHPARTRFVGLDNYVAMLGDRQVGRATLNTLLFTVGAVAIELALGFGLALLQWRDSRFNRVMLALLMVPTTVTPLAVGLVFRALLAPDFGWLGYWAARWGLSGERGFLGDPHTALAALVAVDVWQWTPLMSLILLAGLKSLPAELIEAAMIDGAGGWQRLTRVVLPLLVPTITLAVLLRTMDAFKVFDIIYVTTDGGPGDATDVLMLEAAKRGLEFFDIGTATTLSSVMLACVGVLSVAFIRLMRRADRRVPD